MASEVSKKDTINALLNKDDIASLFEDMLKDAENARFSLAIIVNELGGYNLSSTGGLSHLEWLGLGRMLQDYCEAQADICFEDNKKEPDSGNG